MGALAENLFRAYSPDAEPANHLTVGESTCSLRTGTGRSLSAFHCPYFVFPLRAEAGGGVR